MPNNYFFRTFELKNKFRHLMNETSSKKSYIGQVSRRTIENFIGFRI